MRVHLVSLCILFSISTAYAQWQPDGVPVCATLDEQRSVVASNNGSGVWLAWRDARNGGSIYAQLFNTSGYAQWAADGVFIGPAGGEDPSLSIHISGAEAYISWENGDGSNADIYVQRVNLNGVAQWTPGGVAVCTAAGGQFTPMMSGPWFGVLTVAWVDGRDFPTNNVDVYANRVSSTGTVLNGPNGFAVYAGPGEQRIGSLTSFDNEGTSFVVWEDERNFAFNGFDIYAAFITAVGTVLPIPVCTAVNAQRYPNAIRTESSGALIAWSDERAGRIFAQRVDSTATAAWPLNGIPVGKTAPVGPFFATKPAMAGDDGGGAIIAWARWDGPDLDLFAQRVDWSGARLWNALDVPVCNDAFTQILGFSSIATDIMGGAVIAWTDNRAGGDNVYAQRISYLGAPQWTPNGVAVCAADGQQTSLAAVPDFQGGAIVAWVDERSGFNFDIYANRVYNGQSPPTSIGDISTVARLEQSFPNPFNPATTIPFSIAQSGRVTLGVYDVRGELVASLVDGHRDAGRHVAHWDGRTDAGVVAPTGVYFARLESNRVTETRKLVLLK